MNTLIRKGQSTFFGDNSFSHGISRSGYFNKRESEELALYGKTFEALQNGKLLPENEEEVQFVAAMHTSDESHLYAARLWKKYLEAVEKSRIHHGFSMCNGKTREASGNDLSFS
jgi:uncharacterized protein YifE (UPF0438 family)